MYEKTQISKIENISESGRNLKDDACSSSER